MIASQRPSDVSATVLSQCANFLIHRIQNPEDIDYFKKILPLGSRDLLDQLPILAPGDGLLMGSAVNVPSRVRVQKPVPPPQSDTSRPWEAWQPAQPGFDFSQVRIHTDEISDVTTRFRVYGELRPKARDAKTIKLRVVSAT